MKLFITILLTISALTGCSIAKKIGLIPYPECDLNFELYGKPEIEILPNSEGAWYVSNRSKGYSPESLPLDEQKIRDNNSPCYEKLFQIQKENENKKVAEFEKIVADNKAKKKVSNDKKQAELKKYKASREYKAKKKYETMICNYQIDNYVLKHWSPMSSGSLISSEHDKIGNGELTNEVYCLFNFRYGRNYLDFDSSTLYLRYDVNSRSYTVEH